MSSVPGNLYLLLLQRVILLHFSPKPLALPLQVLTLHHRMCVTPLLHPLLTQHMLQDCIQLLMLQPAGSTIASWWTPKPGRLAHPALGMPQQKACWGGQNRCSSQKSS